MKKLLFLALPALLFAGCNDSSVRENSPEDLSAILQEQCQKSGLELFNKLPHNPQRPEIFYNERKGRCFVKTTIGIGGQELLRNGLPTNGELIHRIYEVPREDPIYSVFIDPKTGEATGGFDSIETIEEWDSIYRDIFQK